MPAYILAQADEILDPTGMQRYVEQIIPMLAQRGARYLVLAFADQLEPLEGDWRPPATAVLEFPSLDDARAFHDDPAYQPLKDLRQRSARIRLLLVDGFSMP